MTPRTRSRQTIFNSSESRRPAGLMRALESRAEEDWREYAGNVGLDGTAGEEEIDVRDRARRRSAAKRTDLEIRMGARMMVMYHPGHCRHIHRQCRRTELEFERATACRHEAHWHVGALRHQDE